MIYDSKYSQENRETCEKFQQSLVFAFLPLASLQLLHRSLDVPLADVKEHLIICHQAVELLDTIT